MDGTREQCSWAVCTSGRPGSYPIGKQLLISQHSHRSPARGAGAPGTSSAPGNCPWWPLKLLLPEANSLHRGPLHLQTSLWTKAPGITGPGLLLQCNQEVLFSQDIFSRKRAGSKCHVSRLLFHGNFGLFKETVITLLPP